MRRFINKIIFVIEIFFDRIKKKRKSIWDL